MKIASKIVCMELLLFLYDHIFSKDLNNLEVERHLLSCTIFSNFHRMR